MASPLNLAMCKGSLCHDEEVGWVSISFLVFWFLAQPLEGPTVLSYAFRPFFTLFASWIRTKILNDFPARRTRRTLSIADSHYLQYRRWWAGPEMNLSLFLSAPMCATSRRKKIDLISSFLRCTTWQEKRGDGRNRNGFFLLLLFFLDRSDPDKVSLTLSLCYRWRKDRRN